MNRELDAQIAERIMGAVWLYWPARESRILLYDAPKWNLEPYKDGDLLNRADELDDVHPYSTNLNYTRLAEQKVIELGHGEAYVLAMHDMLDGKPRPYSIWLTLLTASPEARCRAMLAALAQAEGQGQGEGEG